MPQFAEIHWTEGMFLLPQHLQLFQSNVAGAIRQSVELFLPYAWGVRSLEINAAALENFTISVPACHVRLPDGTEVKVPENADLPDLDIKKALLESPSKPLAIHLGVPHQRPQSANLASEAGKDSLPRRYRAGQVEVCDENTGDNPRPVLVRKLNGRLFLADDEALEYSSAIPILQVSRVGEGEFQPKADGQFVPPTLELEGSPRLFNLAKEILSRASAKSSALAGTIAGQHINFTLDSGGNPEVLLKLHVLNRFIPYYQQLLKIPRLHPLALFVELCRLAGELAIFTEERLPPKLPLYDHGDPAKCFDPMFEIIDDLLKRMHFARAPRRQFEPWGRFLVAALDPEWLDARNQFYLGVDSDLDPKEVVQIMDRGLVSIGSKKTIPDLAKLIRPGIKRRFEERPPPSLPENPRRLYFRLDRAGGEESLTAGAEELALFNGSGKQMEFSLFVVASEDKGFELK
ncbi:MAG: type VI secretion system baseplate subunit TssK [Planctomycetes bacterium]|nr:type VI secretion system baseplate subunit TssK [Planctomycetota bacterium]